MLATFVIGLREGLEAALIVGIIAAFLRRNGKSLTAMWIGVALAVALSIAVGVGLDLIEQALPQTSQEGMEAVIGVLAIFFVTGMIVWMNAHARDMKRQLEAEAAEALSQTGTFALASMAFLAVLREGFETSVFLLATFSSAQSAALAAAGAVIGLAAAVVIGYGIYVGGVKINLSRFFRFTGAFLILVAAGLVITSLRSAHEAGWLNAGQQTTISLSWLVAPGTVQSALITGVLGIPADPRRIEIIGWVAYLVPVTLYLYWPTARRPRPETAVRLRFAYAAALTVLGVGLAAAYPKPGLTVPAKAPIVAAAEHSSASVPVAIGTIRLSQRHDGVPATLTVSVKGSAAEVTLPLPENALRHEQHDGVAAESWIVARTDTPAEAPASLDLDQVVALAGGRIPVGLNPAQHPGPYTADWSIHRSTSVWIADGALLDAAERSTAVVKLSGSGLQTPRTLTVKNPVGLPPTDDWQVTPAYRDQAVAAWRDFEAAAAERPFWTIQLPVALVIAALVLAASAGRMLIRLRRPDGDAVTNPSNHSATTKGVPHATH